MPDVDEIRSSRDQLRDVLDQVPVRDVSRAFVAGAVAALSWLLGEAPPVAVPAR